MFYIVCVMCPSTIVFLLFLCVILHNNLPSSKTLMFTPSLWAQVVQNLEFVCPGWKVNRRELFSGNRTANVHIFFQTLTHMRLVTSRQVLNEACVTWLSPSRTSPHLPFPPPSAPSLRCFHFHISRPPSDGKHWGTFIGQAVQPLETKIMIIHIYSELNPCSPW